MGCGKNEAREEIHTIILMGPLPWTSQSILNGPPRPAATGSCPDCVGVSFHIVSGYEGCARMVATSGRAPEVGVDSALLLLEYIFLKKGRYLHCSKELLSKSWVGTK
jgi:hypothetical protein